MVQYRAPRRALDASPERTLASAAYCREIPGERIEVWPSILWMLGQFVDTNRDFRAWRRRVLGRADGQWSPRGSWTQFRPPSFASDSAPTKPWRRLSPGATNVSRAAAQVFHEQPGQVRGVVEADE